MKVGIAEEDRGNVPAESEGPLKRIARLVQLSRAGAGFGEIGPTEGIGRSVK